MKCPRCDHENHHDGRCFVCGRELSDLFSNQSTLDLKPSRRPGDQIPLPLAGSRSIEDSVMRGIIS